MTTATASRTNGRLEAPETMQSGAGDDQIGVAYSTNDENDNDDTLNANFNQQYLEQQQAYQRSIQEQQQQQRLKEEEEIRNAKVIKTLEAPSTSSLGRPLNQRSNSSSLAPPESHIPAQNRVFGLTKDLAGPSLETAHLDVGERRRLRTAHDAAPSSSIDRMSKMTAMEESANRHNQSPGPSEGPQFSVEVIAPGFDQRGYPVFSGRGARIRGILRTKPLQGGEIIVKLTADISQGSPAAVIDGVALMPPEQGNERRVFTVEDRIPLHESMATLRPGADPHSTNPDDYIYTVPFDVNLPLGVSTRFVNGEQQTTAVALPPSYEMSSANDAKERESTKANNLLRSSASIKSKSSRMTSLSTSAAGFSNSVKEAVEKGLGEVYRIGCFYKIGFTLQKPSTAPVTPPKKNRLGKKKKPVASAAILDQIVVPFIFTGEPTSLPPPPHSIPLTLIAPLLLQANHDLGDRWECERDQAKWSGNFFSTAKRQVNLEMVMPSPAVLQAPCLFPFLLIIRPLDPTLLSSIPSHNDLVPDTTDTDTIVAASRTRPSTVASQVPMHQDKEMLSSFDTAVEHEGLLHRFKSSMSIGKKGSNSNLSLAHSIAAAASASASTAVNDSVAGSSSVRGSIASTYGRRRPNTAPSGTSSSEHTSGTSVIGAGGRYHGSLAGLVKVTLLRTTYSVATGPSEVPKSRRKLISEAELEEVEIGDILGETNQSERHQRDEKGNVAASEADQALIQHVRSRGIRVLRGLVRVSTDATPSFRCQGIEVKYALKVDLIPFSKREKKGGGGGPDSGGSLSGTTTPVGGRRSINLGDFPSSPPLPPFPDELRRSSHLSSASGLPSQQPHYSPSVILGLGGGGGGGTSTVVSESAMTGTRLDKGVGALWADVRMVRSAFAT